MKKQVRMTVLILTLVVSGVASSAFALLQLQPGYGKIPPCSKSVDINKPCSP